VAKPSGNLRRHPVPPLELREVNLEDLEVCIVQHGCHFELVCWIDERILCVLGWSYKFMYRQSMYYITIPMSPQEPEDNVFTPLLSAQVRINK